MGWWHFLQFCRKLIKQIGEDDLSGRAAEMAYKFFLALMPFLIFLVAAGAFVADAVGINDPTKELIDQVGPSLPDDAESLLRTQLEGVTSSHNPALLSIGIIGAVWAASSGVGTVMKALNQIFEVGDDRPMLKRYAIAVGLTLIAGFFIMASVVIIVAGQTYGRQIADDLGLSSFAATLVLVLRFVLVASLILLAVGFVLWAAPAIDLPFRLITPGAVFFMLLWLLFTSLFGLYVSNFGSYNATYGALGGVVVLLVWIYFSSFIFLIAGQINAILAHRESPEAIAKAEAAKEPSAGIIERVKERLPFVGGHAAPEAR
jgi:membrane protein